MPGASNLTSRRRLQLLALVGIIGAVITLIGLTVNFYFDLGTTTSRVAAEQTAEQKVNLTKVPSIDVAQYDQETPAASGISSWTVSWNRMSNINYKPFRSITNSATGHENSFADLADA